VSKELIEKLKNKDTRRKFARGYKDWGVWFEVPETREIYYKFELPEGARIVVMERDFRDFRSGGEAGFERGIAAYYSEHPNFFSRRIISENELDWILLDVKKELLKGEEK
jgi:hypothetical protein